MITVLGATAGTGGSGGAATCAAKVANLDQAVQVANAAGGLSVGDSVKSRT